MDSPKPAGLLRVLRCIADIGVVGIGVSAPPALDSLFMAAKESVCRKQWLGKPTFHSCAGKNTNPPGAPTPVDCGREVAPLFIKRGVALPPPAVQVDGLAPC